MHFYRFRSDHNEDNTLEVVYTWLYKWSNFYHGVNIEYEDEKTRRESEQSQTHWSDERYLDVIRLKEEGLNHARKAWADYVFVCYLCYFNTRAVYLMIFFFLFCFDSFLMPMCSCLDPVYYKI